MRRRTRLLLLLAVGLAGAGIAVAGVLPQGFTSVGAVAADPSSHAGREVHLKGIVQGPVEHGPVRFALTDGSASIPVEYGGSVPDMFGEGRTVLVSGALERRGEGWVLHAHDMQGGCASKYEPAAGEA